MEKKNFYDWLEINRNASPEVIEKAYKTLVRKYHPDLQEEANKHESEEILKQINDAYDTLSDPIKKSDYDAHLQASEISADEYEHLYQEKANLENELNNLRNNTKSTYQEPQQRPISRPHTQEGVQRQAEQDLEDQLRYQEQMQQAVNKAYHDAYVQDLRRRGFKIRYKKTFKDYIRILITIVVIILVIFILTKIPFIRNYFADLYKQNEVIRWIADIFINIFDSVKNAFS